MGQNTPQEMGLDVLGIFMHHPGINPGPGDIFLIMASRLGQFLTQKQSFLGHLNLD